MSRDEVDALWSRVIGSRKLAAWSEMVQLKRVLADGIVTEEQARLLYLTTKVWRGIRYAVLKRDGMACVRCGSTVELQVHHKRYHEIGADALEDLETLCVNCHSVETKRYDLLAHRGPLSSVDVGGQLFSTLRRKGP